MNLRFLMLLGVLLVGVVAVAAQTKETPATVETADHQQDGRHCWDYAVKMRYAQTELGDREAQESYRLAAEAYEWLDGHGQVC